MKRLCNEAEKQLLFKNRNQILKGILQAGSKGKMSQIFVGLFFSMICMIAGIIPLIDIFDVPEFVIWIWFAFSFIVPNKIVAVIMANMRVKKEAKAFLKKDNLMINGATIVNVDMLNGTISYIEDDFLGNNGFPVVIDYPALSSELKIEDIGKRLIVMYDSDSSFQLMKVNDALRSLIPAYSEHYPLTKELKEYKRIPHPNANSIPFCGHVLSDKEKKDFSDLYIASNWETAKKSMVVASFVLIPAVLILSIMFSLLAEKSLINGILIGIAVNIGLYAFIFLMRLIGKKNTAKIARFTYVQEVIFHSMTYNQSGKTVTSTLSVYEWKNEHFELVTYPNLATDLKIKYGDVVYKFTNEKGAFIFVPKKKIMR